MYVTDQDIIAYLKSKDCTYLGEEYGMFFYKLPNGKVEGASEEALVKHIKEENRK